MGVGPLEDAPVVVDVPDGVGVVVPVHVPLPTVEHGVAHEVDDPVHLVHRIVVRVQVVGVDVDALLLAEALDGLGDRVVAVVLVQRDGAVGLGFGITAVAVSW